MLLHDELFQTITQQLPIDPAKRLGVALVGLGRLSVEELLPAFGLCKYTKLVALVSDDRKKAETLADQYGVDHGSIYNYENFDEIKHNEEIDFVYLVLPNYMHCEFTIRAAQACKHVLCEKPMANTLEECERMVAACKKADRKLMIAYRMQYEAYNNLVREFTQEQKLGKVKSIVAINNQQAEPAGHWRLKKALGGGGALNDIGIYCINTIRFLLGEEPHVVSASSYSTPTDERFKETAETVLFQMHFPSGVMAMCSTSYGAYDDRSYRVYAENGWIGLDPAFSYSGLKLSIAQQDDKLNFIQQPLLVEKNHFALEMDHLSTCILLDRVPYTPGEEGLQDMRIIEAIFQSSKEGKPISLPRYAGKDVFRGDIPLVK